MILDRITLENFGVYKGLQSAELTPEEGKPIILFGGMNGGGKTTLLDALQLVLYGPKAKTSNRGRQAYKNYLRSCIHRDVSPDEGASITLLFRRFTSGKAKHFEVKRSWFQGSKDIEENIVVSCDGQVDEIFTDHWDETIEAFLPSSISHLFFFDGEQIKDLAEGQNAAKILGTAIHSLLGVDIINQLEKDLTVFERRKKAEDFNDIDTEKLKAIQNEIAYLEKETENLAMHEGQLVNEAGRIKKELTELEDRFLQQGGDLFGKRKALEKNLEELNKEKLDIEIKLRDLLSGPLPLLAVEPLLAEAESLAQHENEIRKSRLIVDELMKRDELILSEIERLLSSENKVQQIRNKLQEDRSKRAKTAKDELILNANDRLPHQLAHIRNDVLPTAKKQANSYVEQLEILEEKIFRVIEELERVPSRDSVKETLDRLEQTKIKHGIKLQDIEEVKIRKRALQNQLEAANSKLDKLGELGLDIEFAQDDISRALKHSRKTRITLDKFRKRVVQKHLATIESLMLDSFTTLLRKNNLVSGLKVDPSSFEPSLTSNGGSPLAVDKLSAGEKQLLATSLLWGLARAAGRPIPTIIDTPLGRLDSSHRSHLVKRYFPNASHQVLLLSTDQEIVDEHLDELIPFVTRTILLDHNEVSGQTLIKQGYFV